MELQFCAANINSLRNFLIRFLYPDIPEDIIQSAYAVLVIEWCLHPYDYFRVGKWVIKDPIRDKEKWAICLAPLIYFTGR